jgi:hypothetical protein
MTLSSSAWARFWTSGYANIASSHQDRTPLVVSKPAVLWQLRLDTDQTTHVFGQARTILSQTATLSRAGIVRVGLLV